LLEFNALPGRIETDQRLGQVINVTGGEIQSFGAGRRNDVCSVACQKKIAKTDRLGYETAERCNAFFN